MIDSLRVESPKIAPQSLCMYYFTRFLLNSFHRSIRSLILTGLIKLILSLIDFLLSLVQHHLRVIQILSEQQSSSNSDFVNRLLFLVQESFVHKFIHQTIVLFLIYWGRYSQLACKTRGS